MRRLLSSMAIATVVFVIRSASADPPGPTGQCAPGDPLCSTIDELPRKPAPYPARSQPTPPTQPQPKAPVETRPPETAPPPVRPMTPPPPSGPSSYVEKTDKKDPTNTQVVFEADNLAGVGGGPDSVRIVVRPKGPDIACLARYNDITDRELTPLTLRYALRATLRCMNRCLTDQDLDFLTSCDDWDSLAEQLRKLRAPKVANAEGATEDDDPLSALIARPAGCTLESVQQGKTDGKLSGAFWNDQVGRCEITNANFRPVVVEPPPPVVLTPPPQVADTYTPTDAELEFIRYRTRIDVTPIANRELRTATKFGVAAEARWHFSGALHLRAEAGFVGSDFIGAFAFSKAPSRFQYTFVGSLLSIDQGPQRGVFSFGDIGIGIPNKSGASTITIAPAAYFRDQVNRYSGYQSEALASTEQYIGSRFHIFASGRAAILFESGPLDSNNNNNAPLIEQDGIGTFLSASGGPGYTFGDRDDTVRSFLATIRVLASYDRERLTARAATANAERQQIGFDAWTVRASVGGRF